MYLAIIKKKSMLNEEVYPTVINLLMTRYYDIDRICMISSDSIESALSVVRLLSISNNPAQIQTYAVKVILEMMKIHIDT